MTANNNIEVLESGDPIRNLWSSVIRQALFDLELKQIKCSDHNMNRRVRRDSAANFFRSRQSTLPWICQHLNLDINSVRVRAEKIIKEKRQ